MPAPWSSYPDDPFITREIDMQDGMSASGLPNPGQLCPEVVTTIYGLLTEICFLRGGAINHFSYTGA